MPGLYGAFTYGSATYGAIGIPASTTFDVYDFCYPSDASMLTLFGYAEVTPARTFGAPNMYFDGNNDLVMLSDDDLDSGFRVDIAVNNSFTVQFSLIPSQLPPDFTDAANRRIFVAAYNRYGKMIGILLSENGGLALAQTGTGSYTHFADSADLFDEGTDYYTFRITADPDTGTGNLFVTRQDLLPIIGHQLRYTFNLLDSPTGLTDHTLVEVLGTAADPTEVKLDCWRLASSVQVPNSRPVADPGADQSILLGGYAGFDGRSSYDPDGDTLTQFWWTSTDVPEGSDYRIVGTGNTAADASGYTNRINAAASGDFDEVDIGDLLYVGTAGSVVKYRDSSMVVAIDHVFPENVTGASWVCITQEGWGGTRTSGVVTTVLEARTTPPGSPQNGDAYLVVAVATGDWAGEEDRIATYNSVTTSWDFTSPIDNDVVYVIDDTLNRRYVNGDYPAGQWEIDDPLPWEMDRWSGRELQIGTLLPDYGGLFTSELVVRDDGSPPLNSIPAEVILNVSASAVRLGEVPDAGWIWNYLPDFWDIVSDREKITTVWSGFMQVAAGLLLELWQHDYAKALLDIQRIFQKRWLHYDLEYAEPNYDILQASIDNDVDLGGYSAAPGTNEYSYETGGSLTGVTSSHILVLDGTGYRISAVAGTAVVTKDPLPVTGRPVFWQIKPTLTSQSSNFDYERVGAEDIAVFEIIDQNSNTSDIETYVYGARLDKLAFDDGPISGYLANSTYGVRFKAVRRRGGLRINDYIVAAPRLQEVIDREAVAGAPGLLHENLDYIIETESANDLTVNTLRFRDAWTPRVDFGYDGDSSGGAQYFDSPGSDFVSLFGDGADLNGYVLELPSGRYRLYQVISATRLELESEALASATGMQWTIRSLDDPPQYLWAETTHVDNRPTIEANFGRLVGFKVEDLATRTDDLDYLSAVRGLWYTYWFGPTPYNLKVGSQILLGLPFAEQSGTIVDIQSPFNATQSRILIRDVSNTSIVRSYFWPTDLSIETNPTTGVAYTLGDTVEQFAPLCQGVEVEDWVSDEDWFTTYAGSGDFFEPWKIHTFGVVVNAEAFDITNLEFVVSYILRIKPSYTYPWFVVLKQISEIITIDDAMALGPYIPTTLEFMYMDEGGWGWYEVNTELPYGWGTYPIPVGWASSPWEDRVDRESNPIYDITERWPTDRFTYIHRSLDYGGLHLTDTPGRLPDGARGTRAEGAHVLDDTDESGVVIHKLDSGDDATDLATDGDMELAGVANWPDLPSGGPATKQKTSKGGSQTLEISDTGDGAGCYQDFPSSPTPASLETYQIAVTCRVIVEDGQAKFRLRDQDGTSYVAEVRKAWVGTDVWQDVTLHIWAASGTTDEIRFEIMTGPAGGHFYVDDVGFYAKAVPWEQWGLDRQFMGRTGGYTEGGAPDETLTMQIAGEVP
jgi:hypothetical protein